MTRRTRQLPVSKKSERGQMLMLFALLLTGLVGLVGFVVDVGYFLRERQQLQNTVDAAALAASRELPNDASAAYDAAVDYALNNDSDLTLADLDITFRCMVGNVNGVPNPSHIPGTCNPGTVTWACSGQHCVAPCEPAGGDTCNTIVVGSEKNVPFFFSPVIGIDNEDTGSMQAGACHGSCGASTAPLDVVLIIDRSSSMSSSELASAKTAAKDLLKIFNPAYQHVALGVLGPSRTTASCTGANSGGRGLAASSSQPSSWVPVPMSSDYLNADGTINNSSLIVKSINCLNSSSVGTNLGDPTLAAKNYLLTSPDVRPGVKTAIILFTDGAATAPGSQPCKYAVDQATAAKAANIEVFTLGYGLENEDCGDSSPSFYRNKSVTKALADMATQSVDETECDNGTEATQENGDGDHFYCEVNASNLTAIFQQAAQQLASGSRLIRVP